VRHPEWHGWALAIAQSLNPSIAYCSLLLFSKEGLLFLKEGLLFLKEQLLSRLLNCSFQKSDHSFGSSFQKSDHSFDPSIALLKRATRRKIAQPLFLKERMIKIEQKRAHAQIALFKETKKSNRSFSKELYDDGRSVGVSD